MKKSFLLAIGAIVLTSCGTQKTTTTKSVQQNTTYKSICANAENRIEVEFFSDLGSGKVLPIPMAEANNTNEKHVVRMAKEGQAEHWWRFTDLNHDGLKDLVISEGGSVGTSGDATSHVLCNCEGNSFVEVMLAEGQKLDVLDVANSDWADVLITTRERIAGDDIRFEFGLTAFSFDGKAYVQNEKQIQSGGDDWYFQDIRTLGDERESLPKLPNNADKFNRMMLKSDITEIKFPLENGQTKSLSTVRQADITEQNHNTEFVHLYEDKQLVLFKLTKWEDETYLLINLVNGEEVELTSQPEFSPKGDRFLAIQGELDRPEIKSEVEFYSLGETFEKLPTKLELGTRSFKKLYWKSENRLEGIAYESKGLNSQIEREMHIYIP